MKCLKVHILFWCSTLLLLFNGFLACAQEKGIWLTDRIQLKLGDAFMEEGEFYRAITEYKKLLILFPDSEQADYALFKIGMAYYQGEEYESSVQSLSTLRANYKESKHLAQARYLQGISYWKLKQLEQAGETFDSLAKDYPQSPFAPLSLVAASLVALDEENTAESRSRLEQLISRYPDDSAARNAIRAAPLISRYENLPQKSKALASVLSAVIPGTGYVYAGRYGDGITAFFINGLWIAGAVTGIQAEYYAISGVLAGVGLPFYLGNIYGSANAAKKWNLEVKRSLLDQVYLALDFKF
jgi:tetratricopeptide (TPR) repeat protein